MTMTAERLAELDAVMAKATAGEWGVCQCVQLEGDTLFQLEARVEPDTLQCVSTDIAGEDDAAAIVALHNDYPDLRAMIEAQAATIARFRDALAVIRAKDTRTEFFASASGKTQRRVAGPYAKIARAALTGAA